MSDMFLTIDEMKELTGRTQCRAQVRELNHLGIVHKVRADGSILVLRAHVEQVMGLTAKTRTATEHQPNWGFTDRPQLRSVQLAQEKARSGGTPKDTPG